MCVKYGRSMDDDNALLACKLRTFTSICARVSQEIKLDLEGFWLPSLLAHI